ASVAKLFDLSDKAVKEYITVFVDSYLLFELDLFDFSLKKQLRNPKKIYAIDPGVVNAVAFQFSSNVGRLLENAVFLELRRLGLEMYYYKTHNNLEIDFIAKKQLKMTIIQVAWQVQDQKTLEREQRALLSAMDELKLTRGLIITENDEARVVAEDKEIIMMPAYKFFSWPTGKKIEFLFE
ncbi:ATP-binding protein, partial [Candidatus Dependentiae bacterium]|nr:ATP-binding protein [Candidatus Dependentiae bacterium]